MTSEEMTSEAQVRRAWLRARGLERALLMGHQPH
jgi:hypothetical protein